MRNNVSVTSICFTMWNEVFEVRRDFLHIDFLQNAIFVNQDAQLAAVKALERGLNNGSPPSGDSMSVAHAVELISTSKREESVGNAIPKAEGGHWGLSRIDIHEL